MNENINPKISIITVSYNAVKTIEQTILSVINQSYDNIEYIIIDGGSTDGTVDIIKKYEDRIAYWISEPDEGIYDAMNKGIDRATGDWIYFIGADDWLYRNKTIELVVKEIDKKKEFDIVYGKIMLIDSRVNLQKESSLVKENNVFVGIPHQAFFVKTNIIKLNKFDLHYRMAADYDFILYCYLNKYEFYGIDMVIANYSVNGLSSNLIKKCFDEFSMILENNNITDDKQKTFFQYNDKNNIWLKQIIKYFLIKLNLWGYIQSKRGWNKFDDKALMESDIWTQ